MNLVTVYRSMDPEAEEDSTAIRDFLLAQGMLAELVDDSAPGVPEGTFEVLVREDDATKAEQLIAQYASAQREAADPSANLDLETVFHGEGGTTSEFEAMSVKNLLESSGITAVLVGDSVLPNFPFEVRVAREQADLARKLIAEAEQAGKAEQTD